LLDLFVKSGSINGVQDTKVHMQATLQAHISLGTLKFNTFDNNSVASLSKLANYFTSANTDNWSDIHWPQYHLHYRNSMTHMWQALIYKSKISSWMNATSKSCVRKLGSKRVEYTWCKLAKATKGYLTYTAYQYQVPPQSKCIIDILSFEREFIYNESKPGLFQSFPLIVEVAIWRELLYGQTRAVLQCWCVQSSAQRYISNTIYRDKLS